jgi:hypothetical protein
LQRCNLIMQVASNEDPPSPRFLPSRPLDQVRLKEVLVCLRHERRLNLGSLLGETNHFSGLLKKFVEEPGSKWQNLSLQDLLQQAAGSREHRQEPS